MYTDLNYLTNHWEEEKALLDRWCNIIGLEDGEYEIERPESEDRAIRINFRRVLNLEAPVYSDDEEEEVEEEEEEQDDEDPEVAVDPQVQVQVADAAGDENPDDEIQA